MKLLHGIGLYSASILDTNSDVISAIVSEGFSECSRMCNSLQEVCDYHTTCFKELTNNFYAEAYIPEPWDHPTIGC